MDLPPEVTDVPVTDTYQVSTAVPDGIDQTGDLYDLTWDVAFRHPPVATGYLKVWIVGLKWTTDADPPVVLSTPIVVDAGTYEWVHTGDSLLANPDVGADDASAVVGEEVNTITGSSFTSPGTGFSLFIQRWSYVPGYTPVSSGENYFDWWQGFPPWDYSPSISKTGEVIISDDWSN